MQRMQLKQPRLLGPDDGIRRRRICRSRVALDAQHRDVLIKLTSLVRANLRHDVHADEVCRLSPCKRRLVTSEFPHEKSSRHRLALQSALLRALAII